MNAEEINNRIQTENNYYDRSKNRLEQKLLDLKQRHQRIIADLKRQKEQIKSLNKQEKLNIQHKLSKNIFITVNETLNKYI